MSDLGTTTVSNAGLWGMVQVKGDLSDSTFREVCAKVAGAPFPAQRAAEVSGESGLLWMAPDEVLVLCPRTAAPEIAAQISEGLAGQHHLSVDVSDARAVFAIEGPDVRECLARLTPANMHPAAMPTGELRRSRIAQVAAAFWLMEDGSARVICFRSVADYVGAVLAGAASEGSVGHLPQE